VGASRGRPHGRGPDEQRADAAQAFATGLPDATVTEGTGGMPEAIRTDSAGSAEFRCQGRGVSI
jgi:hypothetical protein